MLRRDCATPRRTLHRVGQSPRLGPDVSIRVRECDVPSPWRLERVLPTANVDIIINLADDELRTYADDGRVRRHPGAVLSGPASRACVIDSDETTNLVTVSFAHGTASAYLRHSLDELTDDLVPLDELFGRVGSSLRERLLETPTRAAKVDLVEQMLLAAAPAPVGSSVVDSALAALDRGFPVHIVNRRLEISARQLGRLFRAHVGMTPKRYARIRRLQRVLRSVHAASDPNWSAVAADHRYTDQSHLIRDFRDLAGLTPTSYLAMVTGAHNHVAFVQSTGPLAA
jgi:AraC-like DNA-binding protein